MTKSNRGKRRLLNLAYRSLNAEYKNSVKIKRDPLCRRYEVNRYCAAAYHKTKTPKELIRFIESVMKKRYPDAEVNSSYGTLCSLSLNGYIFHMYVYQGMDNKEWVSFGVH